MKKITAFSGAVTGTLSGFSKPVWYVNIDQGGVLGGSSGSPLFDANKRMVGHVSDGNTDCGPGRHIWAPKFSGNWNGATSGERLKDWLDAGNSGGNTLNGADLHIRVKVKMFLQGAYDIGSGLMRTDLATMPLVPTAEPYTGGGYIHYLHGGGETTTTGVITASGNAKIVDWVVVELRQSISPFAVIATRSALLRKDGVVADVDGSTNGVLFDDLPGFSYRVAVRHRNPLGIITNTASNLLTTTLAGTTFDFSSTSGVALYGTDPTYITGTARCLWMGDVTKNGIVQYVGAGNDRDPILVRVGSTTPNTVVNGYYYEDTTMDGAVKYVGAGNDRDPILVVVGSTTPNNTRTPINSRSAVRLIVKPEFRAEGKVEDSKTSKPCQKQIASPSAGSPHIPASDQWWASCSSSRRRCP